MRAIFIYALVDPKDYSVVRYVGRTVDMRRRFSEHIGVAKQFILGQCKCPQSYSVHWVASLLRQGRAPIMSLLIETDEIAWAEQEQYWIQYYADKGHPLTNIQKGGINNYTFPPLSEETRRRKSIATKGRKCSAEQCLQQSLRKRGVPLGPCKPETKMKISIANTGKQRTDETKAKISANNRTRSVESRERGAATARANGKRRGIPRPEETKRKISVANKGRVVTVATRKKISLAQKGIPKDPEVVQRRAATRKGCVMSEETKAKISAAYHNKSADEKLRISESNSARLRGRVLSDESRAKISAANKGRKLSDETRARMHASKTPEYRAKVSVINRWRHALQTGAALCEADMALLSTIRDGYYLTLTANDVIKSDKKSKKERPDAITLEKKVVQRKK